MNIVKRCKVAAAAVAFTGLPSLAIAADANLQSDDFVGISFWLISMALVASTVFFFIERDRVDSKWKTSLTVSGLVTLVAAVHYFYMRDVWVSTGETPTVYRYIDWLITVPLLMVEFFLILSAITAVPARVFWRLLCRYNADAGIRLSGRSRLHGCDRRLCARHRSLVVCSL
jgi:bacteriorhodopsin